MKEKDFVDKRVAFEDKLVEVIRPALRRCVPQNAGEWQALELIGYLGRSPQFCVGKQPAVAIAGKKCECTGCGAAIVKSERCFDIPNPRAAFSNPRRFCQECFKIVLAKTRTDVAKLEAI
jgi:hypothetical protein